MKKFDYDLCVLGGGAAGLSVAAGAAQLGASVVLLEPGEMGGDCLNSGCVPSKSLLASAKRAQSIREAEAYGISATLPQVDFPRVQARIKKIINSIAPHDSVERFEGLGVRVIKAAGRFTKDNTVVAGEETINAKRYVIATGSSPMVPPIPGLDSTPYLTNETVFELMECPNHLIVIGAGPIGCEMAQGFRGLGAKVTLLDMGAMLPRDDRDLVAILRKQFVKEGIVLQEKVNVKQVQSSDDNQIHVTFERGGDETVVQGSHLLIAAGRRANLAELNLRSVGVDWDNKGVMVNKTLRSKNKRIYAIGDAAGPYQFTHMASYHAGIVIRNALFRFPTKVNYQAVPWVTYTALELAQIGLTEAEVLTKYAGAQVLTWDLGDNDRARTEGYLEGKMKVMVSRRGRVLGVSILAPNAGELLLPWSLMISQKLPLSAMAGSIVPYPTYSELSKQVAGSYYTKKLFSNPMKKVVELLGQLP